MPAFAETLSMGQWDGKMDLAFEAWVGLGPRRGRRVSRQPSSLVWAFCSGLGAGGPRADSGSANAEECHLEAARAPRMAEFGLKPY